MASDPAPGRRLVFGLDVPCSRCKGRGTEHTRHRYPSGEWVPCGHICTWCKGVGIIHR